MVSKYSFTNIGVSIQARYIGSSKYLEKNKIYWIYYIKKRNKVAVDTRLSRAPELSGIEFGLLNWEKV